MPDQIIHLHRDSPPKPREGEPCNGCGVCCGLETCPAGRLRFRRKRGPCPALEWSVEDGRYFCGLLRHPDRYLRWLPPYAAPLAQRLMRRWIAAGAGCDCSAEVAGN